ncbi:hypothetical protein [Halomonas sp. SCS19]|uniref:hypothetical protein n=1 Tax=Halomonas sp. SCS19 TaxID=2950870 RepID=UPI0032E009F9
MAPYSTDCRLVVKHLGYGNGPGDGSCDGSGDGPDDGSGDGSGDGDASAARWKAGYHLCAV